MIQPKIFIVSAEVEVKIISIEDEYEAKLAAMRIAQDRLNGSDATKLQFHVVDAELK